MSKRAKQGAPNRTRKPARKRAAEAETPEVPTGPERVFVFADQMQSDESDQPETQAAEADWETWVTFRLAGEVFALTVDAVREIVRVGTVTRVPHAPYPVRGIINLRGRVVPVVDLRVRIGLPRTDINAASRILIATLKERVLGLLVDGVDQVDRIDRNTVTAPPADVMTGQSEYIVGVTRQNDTLLILLDSSRVLLVPEGLETQRSRSEVA